MWAISTRLATCMCWAAAPTAYCATGSGSTPPRWKRRRTGHDWQALEHDIAQYLAHKLPADHQPDDVRIVEEIPRSFLNKMLRREVRLMLEAAPPRMAPAPTTASPTASLSAAHP